MPDYYAAIDAMRTQKKGDSVARHKPLLLLLVLAKISSGHPNRFVFEQIEEELVHLLEKFGERPRTKIVAHYPFVFLAGESLLWHCTLTRQDLPNPKSLSRSAVLHQVGHLQPEFLKYLLQGRNLGHTVGYLLHRYWSQEFHQPLVQALGLGTHLIEIQEAEYYARTLLDDPQAMFNAFGVIPSAKVWYRDEHFWVMEDAYPVSPGHCLVISQEHRLDYWDLSVKEQAHLPYVIRTTRQMIDALYLPDGYNIGMNCGQAAGQTIFHFHCHIIPRYNGDTPTPRGGIRHCIPGKGYYDQT